MSVDAGDYGQAEDRGVRDGSAAALASQHSSRRASHGIEPPTFPNLQTIRLRLSDLWGKATATERPELVRLYLLGWVRGVRATHSTPVGAAEIAERLGVKPATVDQWVWRKVMPPPDWTVGGRPAWDWATTILPWAQSTGRLPDTSEHMPEGWRP